MTKALNSEASDRLASLASQLVSDGYLHLGSDTYAGPDDLAAVTRFQESYFRLPADTGGGNRFRAYSRFTLTGEELRLSANQDYMQTAEYNYTDGGKVRKFAPLEAGVRDSDLVRRLIQVDTSIIRGTGLVPFENPVRVGLHQVRYRPTAASPSFSSPPGLHRDQETIVFIHLLNLSANTLGGDNVVAVDEGGFEAVLRLEHALDTLCVSRKKLHAVMPVGIRSGAMGFRDILLVTVEPERDM